MEKKFKKIMAVVGSTFILGATMGMAFAAGGGFPTPFVKDNNADYAIVYGANAAASDMNGANSINTYLNTFYSANTASYTGSSTTETITTSDFSSAVSLSDEIELGTNDIIEGSKLRAKLEDNKISTLLDTQIDWDNGDGTDSYDVHEEILLTNDNGVSELKLVNNLNHINGEDFDSFVVLQNDQSLRYRLVFDDELKYEGEDDAKDLRVSILGKEYDITNFNDNFNDITISLSEEKVVKKGTVLNIEGVALTIGDIFYEKVEVNGVLIKQDSIKNINGIEVKVVDTAYHSDSIFSKAVIKVGKDIKKDISTGDEYIKDDETWEWDIGIDEGKQYIGVKYAISNVAYDEDDTEENPIQVGESYIFPENYAALSFDSLTDVNYKDFEVSFDDRDLYNGTVTDENPKQNDIDVAILEGEEDDSFTLEYNSAEVETNMLYFQYTEEGVGVYFKDIDGDVDSDKKGRIQLSEMYKFSTGTTTEIIEVNEINGVPILGEAPIIGYTYNDGTIIYEVEEISFEGVTYYIYYDGANFLSVPTGEEKPVDGEAPIIGYTYNGEVATYNEVTGNYEYTVTTIGTSEDVSYDIATLIYQDTEMQVGLNLNKEKTVDLTLSTDGADTIRMRLGNNTDGNFTHLGIDDEDADSKDIIVGDKSIGNWEGDVMDHYGTIIRDPEGNSDDDRVILSIPSEKVLAKVSIKGQGEVITTTETIGSNETSNETIVEEIIQLGGIVVKDNEASSFKDKNLIIVGGSCINSEAARLLGGQACGEEFTLKTGVIKGQALVQTFTSQHNAEKVAIVIAGYDAADTTRAVNAFINDGNLDTARTIL